MVFATAEASGLSLVAAASWGGGDFCGGLASKRASVFRVVAVAHGCGLIAMLTMAWLTGEAIPPRTDLWWGAFAGLVGAFGIAALYRALAIAQARRARPSSERGTPMAMERGVGRENQAKTITMRNPLGTRSRARSEERRVGKECRS